MALIAQNSIFISEAKDNNYHVYSAWRKAMQGHQAIPKTGGEQALLGKDLLMCIQRHLSAAKRDSCELELSSTDKVTIDIITQKKQQQQDFNENY